MNVDETADNSRDISFRSEQRGQVHLIPCIIFIEFFGPDFYRIMSGRTQKSVPDCPITSDIISKNGIVVILFSKKHIVVDISAQKVRFVKLLHIPVDNQFTGRRIISGISDNKHIRLGIVIDNFFTFGLQENM